MATTQADLTFANVIDGCRRPTALSTEIVAPATGQVYATAPLSRAEDVDIAFAAARNAFRAWRKSTPGQRQHALLQIADRVEADAHTLATLESRDTGKPFRRVLEDEVPGFVDQLRFFAAAARHLSGMASAEYVELHTSSIRREPVGVCAQITPWNYPMTTALWKWAPAIAAGNTVVLKPSELTPASTSYIATLAADILPQGVLNVVCGDGLTGQLLTQHPQADLVSLTGSTRAGRQVTQAAAQHLSPVHLELGGKAPAIVFADGATQATAAAIAGAAFYNAGQDCAAVTRVLVQDTVADEFISRLVAETNALRTGPGDDQDFGSLISSDHLKRVEGYLERLPPHARILAGGTRVGGAGYFFAPTLIGGVRQDDEIVQGEVFGPVLTVQAFNSESDALDLANGTPYGLTASVWTTNHGHATRCAAELSAGVVWINSHTVFAAEMPHGGFGLSGHGKELSSYGFEQYTRIKHIMTNLAV